MDQPPHPQESKLPQAAVLSTGVAKELDSCRKDILAFLRMLRWRVAALQVKVWTVLGLLYGERSWTCDGSDYETLAESVARFITESDVETCAIVLAHRSTATAEKASPLPRRRPLMLLRSLSALKKP